jgi:hypothetical protein
MSAFLLTIVVNIVYGMSSLYFWDEYETEFFHTNCQFFTDANISNRIHYF